MIYVIFVLIIIIAVLIAGMVYLGKSIKEIKDERDNARQSDVDKSKNIQGLADNAVKVDKIKKESDITKENIDNAETSAQVMSELDNLINTNNSKLHNSK